MAILTTIKDCAGALKGYVKADFDEVDPISVLAITAIMPFQEENSKLRVAGNLKVEVQQPSDYKLWGYNYRWFFRTIQRASQSDLAIINRSIMKAARWYQPWEEKNEEIRKLFQSAQKGLAALRKTYEGKSESELTICGLDNLSSLIEKSLAERLEEEMALDETAKKMKALWDEAKIKEVNLLITQMYEVQGKTLISEAIKCYHQITRLEVLLEQKAERLREIFRK